MDWWWVLVIELVIILLAALVMFLASLPELRRYLNMKSM